jgi:hypothetical protein
MRIWDIPPKLLCRQHLLGEHRELHAIWTIITQKKSGYSRHPETLRWIGKTKALFNRHKALVTEMTRRGYNHKSPLERRLARGSHLQRTFIDSPTKQRQLLRNKKCDCNV